MSRLAGLVLEIMIAEMLGVDIAARDLFKKWSRSFTMVVTSQAHSPEDLQLHLNVLEQMFEYFDAVITETRANPREDLITDLIQAEEDGSRLTKDELRATCAQLLAAGNETTTNLIGNSVICLAQRPELRARLQAEPELMPGFIEEVLRFLGPAQFVPRYVKKPAVLYGQQLDPGTPVFAMLASANRDEAWFQNPNDFDPQRNPNRHLDFGTGIHFCLGAALARLETKVTLERMLHQLPGEWSIPAELERLPEVPFFFGVTALPLTVG